MTASIVIVKSNSCHVLPKTLFRDILRERYMDMEPRFLECQATMAYYNPVIDMILCPLFPRASVMTRDWIRIRRYGRFLASTINQVAQALSWLHAYGKPNVTQRLTPMTIEYQAFKPLHLTITVSGAFTDGHTCSSPEEFGQSTLVQSPKALDSYSVGLILVAFLTGRKTALRITSLEVHSAYMVFIKAQIKKRRTGLKTMWKLALLLLAWNPHDRLPLDTAAAWCKDAILGT